MNKQPAMIFIIEKKKKTGIKVPFWMNLSWYKDTLPTFAITQVGPPTIGRPTTGPPTIGPPRFSHS